MSRHRVDVHPDARVALEALSLLSKKWHPVVVVVLDRRGPLGFNDLLEEIQDVSGKSLSGALGELVDAGVVDRTVVSESPLRVEYDLTGAGRELTSIFDELAEWGERHLEREGPTVLVADADRRLTELYGGWLEERYTVVRAHDGTEFEAALEADPDVVVFEHGLPGMAPEAVLEAVPAACRTISLVGYRPGFDVAGLECDDVLRKPIVRETALEAVDEQLSRRADGESDERRERASLAARRSLLESCYAEEVLERSEAYVDLRSRLGSLESASSSE